MTDTCDICGRELEQRRTGGRRKRHPDCKPYRDHRTPQERARCRAYYRANRDKILAQKREAHAARA